MNICIMNIRKEKTGASETALKRENEIFWSGNVFIFNNHKAIGKGRGEIKVRVEGGTKNNPYRYKTIIM